MIFQPRPKAPPPTEISVLFGVGAWSSQGTGMIRTGEEYRAGLRDGREIWIEGERLLDVTTHPAFKPVVDSKARMYDMAHEGAVGRGHALSRWRRVLFDPAPTANRERSLAREMAGDRPLPQRHPLSIDPCRRRDYRLDVVTARRPRDAERDRSSLRRQYRPAHPPRSAARPLPRLGEHRSQGRPLEAPARSGP